MTAWPGGQFGFWLVMITCPSPAGACSRYCGRVRSVVEDQQPAARAGRQHGVHRRSRIPALQQIPGAQQDSQLAEPRRHRRRILGGQLPDQAQLGQVPVRVLDRHAGLARAAHPVQGHHPRARPGTAAAQPDVQASQQGLAAGQERRPAVAPAPAG